MSMTLNSRKLVSLLALSLLAPALAVGQTPTRGPDLASATAKELWRKGSDQILAGDFASAIPTLEQVQRIEPGHREVASTLDWMRQARSLAESRERYRAAMYQHWVDEAMKSAKEAREAKSDAVGDKPEKKPSKKEAVADSSPGEEAKEGDEEEDDKGYKWSKALTYAVNAQANAKDEENFQKEPWLTEIVENVLAEIDRHKAGNEWRDAAFLYDMLHRIYPKEEKYETEYKFCAKRAHLEIVYGPKSTWKSDLRDVNAQSLRQILQRMDADYVESLDFKKLTQGAIEHLILLAEADNLNKTFPSLSDKDRVRNFVSRLNGLLRSKVQPRSRLSVDQTYDIVKRVLDANQDTLELPEAVIVDEFVVGLMEPLDDFTSVIWPSEVDDFNKHTRGDFVGVGIQITQDVGKHVRVDSPLEDSPAYRAGIKPGDFITAVDGKSTLDININQAVNLITGEPGSKVTLTILDPTTDKSREVPLVREQIKLRTVRGHQRDASKATGWDYMIDPQNRVCYARISGFMDKTVDDLEAALKQMRRDGCRGLILDLRFNPGGLLTSAVRMCELFLREDEPIVQTRGRGRQQNVEIHSKSEETLANFPIVVLVNEYSASASEIVAGALAGLKEACVVGTRTYGKGSVQNLIPIADNQAYLKLTTAYYYVFDKDSPSDPWFCLHRRKGATSWGIDPHITVKVIPQEVTKILRLRRERDVLKGRDQAEVPKEILERRPTSTQPQEKLPEDENPSVDPQITAALDIMRVKLMSDQPWALAPRMERALSKANAEPPPDSKAIEDR